MFAPRELFWTMAKYLSVNKTKTFRQNLFSHSLSRGVQKVNVKN